MKRAILIATVLTFGLSLSAFAALPTFEWTTLCADTFDNATNGASIVNVVATGGGAWGGDGNAEFTGYLDGTNMALLAKNRSGGTGMRWVGLDGDDAGSKLASVNRMSFKAKFVTRTSTRADRGVVTNFNGGSGDNPGEEWANGTDGGTGFQFSQQTYAGSLGAGGLANWTGYPTGSYQTERVTMGSTWTQFDMIMYRADVGSIAAGTIEYYVDGNLAWTLTPQQTGEWVLGADLAAPTRWMKDFELWAPGKDASGTMQYLIDDISIQYAGTATVPEPSSLIAFATFGIGALGLIRRRRA